MLVFQVDLFSARGPLPRDMLDVLSRQKDIQYSSRTRLVTDYYMRQHALKLKLKKLLAKLPADQFDDEDRALKHELDDLPEITILQMIYQQMAYEGRRRTTNSAAPRCASTGMPVTTIPSALYATRTGSLWHQRTAALSSTTYTVWMIDGAG